MQGERADVLKENKEHLAGGCKDEDDASSDDGDGIEDDGDEDFGDSDEEWAK